MVCAEVEGSAPVSPAAPVVAGAAARGTGGLPAVRFGFVAGLAAGFAAGLAAGLFAGFAAGFAAGFSAAGFAGSDVWPTAQPVPTSTARIAMNPRKIIGNSATRARGSTLAETGRMRQ